MIPLQSLKTYAEKYYKLQGLGQNRFFEFMKRGPLE